MRDSVWTWIHELDDSLYEKGQADIADKINNFSSMAYAKDQAGVEAALPELLAFARSESSPWLEVYLRHWRLQAYINTETDPQPWINEGLDLLAFAHQDEAKDCPQRVCVADDLAALYRAVDGQGFAQARLEMLEEILETLPHSRECLTCIGYGKIAALCDVERGADAAIFFEDMKQNVPEFSNLVGTHHYNQHLAHEVARAYLKSGDLDKAFAELQRFEPTRDMFHSEKDIMMASYHALKGNLDEAKTAFERAWSVDKSEINVQRLLEFLHLLLDQDVIDGDEVFLQGLVDVLEASFARGRPGEAFDGTLFILDRFAGSSMGHVLASAKRLQAKCEPLLSHRAML